jgi:hypothetical protein
MQSHPKIRTIDKRITYPCELEVKRNIVDSHEDGSRSGGGTDEEKDRCARKHHLNWEDSSLLGLPWHVQGLTECESNQSETKADETANDLGAVPREFVSAELKSEDKRADASAEEHETDPVDFAETSHKRGSLECIERRDKE